MDCKQEKVWSPDHHIIFAILSIQASHTEDQGFLGCLSCLFAWPFYDDFHLHLLYPCIRWSQAIGLYFSTKNRAIEASRIILFDQHLSIRTLNSY